MNDNQKLIDAVNCKFPQNNLGSSDISRDSC